MAVPNLNSLATATFRNQMGDSIDNIYNAFPLLSKLRAEDGFETRMGGLQIDVPIRYVQDGTAMSFSGYDQVNVTPVDTISNATYNWKNLHVPVVISEEEIAKNRGKWAVQSLLKQKRNGAELDAKQKLTTVLFSDGTGNSGKDPLGLQAIMALDPSSGTLGGINGANFTFWRNKSNSSISTGVTGSALTSTSTLSAQSYFIRALSNQANNCSRGGQLTELRPNLYVTTQVLYEMYKNNLLDKVRYLPAATKNQNLGFDNYVMFEGIPMIWDPALTPETINSVASTSRIYLINTAFLKVILNEGYDWKFYPFESPIDQYVSVAKMHWMGQLVCEDRSRQGVISGFTTNS